MSNEPPPPTVAKLASLEEYDKNLHRPPFVLTWAEVKLLGITGVGFFLDGSSTFSTFISPQPEFKIVLSIPSLSDADFVISAYDLFIINVCPFLHCLQLRF